MLKEGSRPFLSRGSVEARRWIVSVLACVWLSIAAAQATQASEAAPDVLTQESYLNALEMAWGAEAHPAGPQHAAWSTASGQDGAARAELAALQLEEALFQRPLQSAPAASRATSAQYNPTNGIAAPNNEPAAGEGLFLRLVAISLGLGLIVLAAANSRKRRPTILRSSS